MIFEGRLKGGLFVAPFAQSKDSSTCFWDISKQCTAIASDEDSVREYLLTLKCTTRNSTHVIPFRVQFRAGLSLFEQVVYASKKAMIAGQLRPGNTFPSVRTLSKELKINPNTAAKIVAHLVNEGLLETRPGVGTVVAVLPDSTRKERTQLLGQEIEEVVVEAKRLGIGLDEILDSITDHWKRLTREDMAGNKPNDGGRRER